MKNIFKIILVLITFNLTITGCLSTQKEMNIKMEDEKAKSRCEEFAYLGNIPTGIQADIEQGSQTIVNFIIGNSSCTAIANSKANYQTDKIYLNFDSIMCNGNEEVKAKGQILDKECIPGISAKHITNTKAVKFLEDMAQKYPFSEYQKELLRTKLRYLETQPNINVFIHITEPFYFMHKERIHEYGY